MDLVKEGDVGILEYLNKENAGFKGKIKERFSDFNVAEVTPDGKLVNLWGDDASNSLQSKQQDNSTSSNENKPGYEGLSDDVKKIVSEKDFNEILKIPTGEVEKFELNVETLSKEDRKHAHTVSKLFNLESNTVTDSSGHKVIQFQKASKTNNRGGINHGQRGRSKAEKFLHFSLYKENIGTNEIVSQIAQAIRTKDRYFSFAGTKDRRGRTVQRVAVSLIKPETIENAVKRLKCTASIGNYTYHPEGLRLGDLSGNRFEVAIKDVSIQKERVDSVMTFFKDHGFINYFGMQRFGTSEVPTHQIGLKILKKDLQGAIDLILMPRDHQFRDLQVVLKQYAESGDAESAFKSLSYKLKNRIEGKLLNGLRNHHENDKTNALKFIPSGIKQMYGHAFQSYIWNSVVSERIGKFGTKVLVGDLVADKDGESAQSGGIRMKVKPIRSEEEVSRYSIYDVMIPLPGHASVMPDNVTRDLILDRLKEHDLDMNSFKNSIRDYDLPGGYRNIVVKASNVTWKLVKHQNLSDDLIHSQLELLNNRENGGDLREIGSPDGSLTSMVLGITLPSSCYATMALREIMRVPTDVRSLKSEAEGIDGEEESEVSDSKTSVENGDADTLASDKSDTNGVSAEKDGYEKRKHEGEEDNAAKKLKTDN